MISKPMLASDYIESKLRFPLIAQPKIDGVRALNLVDGLTGRSLKRHANKFITHFFSHPELIGFDGEMAAERETHPDLCRITTSAMSSIEGQPFTLWWLFDYVRPDLVKYPYEQRLFLLQQRLEQLWRAVPQVAERLRIVPSVKVETLDQLLMFDEQWLSEGYEGTIIRDPNGVYKEGRSTVREGGLLRIKRFVDAEAVVVEIIEGETNLNDAQVNELGQQFRSTHQANMQPNGMVGAMMCKLLKDVSDLQGNLLFRKDEIIKVGAGRMPHEDRVRYFKEQDLLMDRTIKFKMFPKGVKDKPRFPTFQSIRSKTDL